MIAAGEVVVDGVRSPVLHAGPSGESEAVVFVHGNPGSSEDWSPLVKKTGTFARAVAIDMPAFGRADRPARFDHTVEGYAAHLDGALRQLGIARAHLVLHDFGGPWGLAWAARSPQQLASATLINTGVLVGYRWHKLARLWRTPVVGELMMAAMSLGNAEKFGAAIGAGRPLPRGFTDRMFRDIDAGTRRAVLKIYRSLSDLEGLRRRLQAVLAPLDRPALVVWGRHDQYIPVEQAERQRQTFPRAEVCILDESGHWPMADKPEVLEQLVLPFLRRVTSGRVVAAAG